MVEIERRARAPCPARTRLDWDHSSLRLAVLPALGPARSLALSRPGRGGGGMAGRRHGAASLVLCAALLLARLDAEGATTGKDVWAEKWCELNDCYGIREAEQRQGALAKVEREHRKATRRYRATGEIKALNSEAVATAWFGYDGPTLDHPAFPGVAAEHAERAERAHEEHALGVRKVVQQRTIAPPQPGGGYLLPDSSEATQLAVREQDDSAIGVARRRHGVMKEQLRMDCMYGYAQESDGNGGFVYGGGRTTVPKAPKGCAAGSVWQDDGRGGVNLVSRTAEAAGSVWRKVNGTDREWWEDVEPVPKNVPWVQSWKQYRSAQLIPYKQRAPPPCSPGAPSPPSTPVTHVVFWRATCCCRLLCLRRMVSPAPIYLRCVRAPTDVQRGRLRRGVLQEGAGHRRRLRR